MSGYEAFRGVSCFGKMNWAALWQQVEVEKPLEAVGCWPCGMEGQQGGLGWRKRT